MDDTLDPLLRSERSSTAYGNGQPAASPYTLNPIRLPPPQQQRDPGSFGLPPLSHDGGGLPYYSIQDQRTQAPPPLPDGQYHHDPMAHSLPQLHHTSRKDDLKRPRACEACRGLKVRCDPDPIKGTCRRCAKAGRRCVVTVPSRKRQKKTDSRVAELEKKIDALTASLQATKNQGASGSEDDSSGDEAEDAMRPYDPGLPQEHPLKQETSPWSNGNASAHMRNDRKRRLSSPGGQPSAQKPRRFSDRSLHGSNNQPESISALDPALSSGYADVVDRRLLDADQAADIFDHFVNHMVQHFPIIAFPPGTTAPMIRRTKPILFLAILSVSSGYFDVGLQKALMREASRIYADAVIIKGDKSIELIQALQLSALWYTPGEHRESSAYQLSHAAALMAMTMGFGREANMTVTCVGMPRHRPGSRNPTFDPHSTEGRRAWLACFLLCGSAGLGFKQPNLIRWSAYLEECIFLLENSSDAAPTDKLLCCRVKLKQISDELCEYIHSLDASCSAKPAQETMQQKAGYFDKKLQAWESRLTPENSNNALVFTYRTQVGVVGTLVLRSDDPNPATVEELAEGFGEEGKQRDQRFDKLSLLEPLKRSLRTCHDMFDSFLAFSAEDLQTIPIYFFIQLTYGLLNLLAFYYSLVDPSSKMGKIFPLPSLKMEHYLTVLMESLQAAAKDGKSAKAHNVRLVFGILQSRLVRQKDGLSQSSKDDTLDPSLRLDAQPVDPGSNTPTHGYKKLSLPADGGSTIENGQASSSPRETAKTQDPSNQQHPPIAQLPSNTPLHLLSEVAAVDSTGTHHLPSHHPADTWQHQPHAQQAPPQQNGYPGPPMPLPSMPHHAYPIPDQQHPYYSQSVYSQYGHQVMHPLTGMGMQMDSTLEQALGMAFGEDNDMSSMFMEEGMMHLMNAANEMEYGEWQGEGGH